MRIDEKEEKETEKKAQEKIEEDKEKFIEREINLSLINAKINYIISLLEEDESK